MQACCITKLKIVLGHLCDAMPNHTATGRTRHYIIKMKHSVLQGITLHNEESMFQILCAHDAMPESMLSCSSSCLVVIWRPLFPGNPHCGQSSKQGTFNPPYKPRPRSKISHNKQVDDELCATDVPDPCLSGLDGQNRQSPIASDFGSRTQIAALFAVLLYRNV